MTINGVFLMFPSTDHLHTYRDKKASDFGVFKVRGYLLYRMGFLHIFKEGLLGSATENNCEIIRKTELCRERE